MRKKNLKKKFSKKKIFKKKFPRKKFSRKKIFPKKFPQKILSEKNSQKKFSNGGARRAPSFAAEGCSPPQELERSPP